MYCFLHIIFFIYDVYFLLSLELRFTRARIYVSFITVCPQCLEIKASLEEMLSNYCEWINAEGNRCLEVGCLSK